MSGLAPSITTGFTPFTFTAFRQLVATTYAAQAAVPANDAPGSTLGAMWNAVALLACQAQLANVRTQSIARLATSTGGDVDTFVIPFGVERLSATAATGGVLCTTPSPVSSQLVVPVGGLLQISNGNGLSFTIIADTTNGAYSQAAGGYVIAPGGSSVTVTVQCNTVGIVGNIQAGQTFVAAGGAVTITGVATFTNPSAFTNAISDESDAALQARFTLNMSAGRVGTGNALAAAVTGTQAGLTYSIGDQLLAQVLTPTMTALGSSVAGSLAAATYFVRITGVGSSGETQPSTEASFAVPANSVLTVASPATTPGMDHYNVYVSTSTNTETKQNASPIALGTSWTMPTTGLISGAALPTINTTVGPITAPGYVCVPVNVLGTSTGPSTTLVNNIQGALNNVRSAGITVVAAAPALVSVNVGATLVFSANVLSLGTQTSVKTAVSTAVAAYINNIGLVAEGVLPSDYVQYCRLFSVASAILQVPGVQAVDSVTLNSGTSDVSAPFAKQIVCGTVTLSP